MNRELLLREMSQHFTAIANWAVNADDFEVTVINEELAKLATHLETMKIVQDAGQLGDLMNGKE